MLLVGPCVSGKSSACLDRIRACLRDNPLTEVWAVLPDPLQSSAFSRRFAESGGAIGAHIATFDDLYRSILERAGRSIPVACEPVLHRIIADYARSLAARGDLSHYAAIVDKPGFIRAMRDRFAELKRALVLPGQLADASASLGSAQRELALLYAEYQTEL